MAPMLFPGAPVCGPFLGQPQVRALENLRPGVAGEGVASRWDFLTRPQGRGILWPLGRWAQTCSSSTSAPLGPKEEVFGQSHRWERRGGCPGRPGEGCAAQGSPSLGCSLLINRIVTCSRPCTTTGETGFESCQAASERRGRNRAQSCTTRGPEPTVRADRTPWAPRFPAPSSRGLLQARPAHPWGATGRPPPGSEGHTSPRKLSIGGRRQ